MTELLEVRGLSAGYGAARVLEDVNLVLGHGQSMALLGRNGVGKSTLLMTLMGLTREHAGEIFFNGKSLKGVATDRRARQGLGWVPQERLIFPSLSVRQNLQAVARPGYWTIERVWQLFPRLLERAGNGGAQLSGGEQQMLAIGRALVTNPSVLLLDEPMEGLAPIVVQELVDVIRNLVESGRLSVILVEQHAHLALELTRHAVILDRGRVVYRGACESLRDEPERLHGFLGLA